MVAFVFVLTSTLLNNQKQKTAAGWEGSPRRAGVRLCTLVTEAVI